MKMLALSFHCSLALVLLIAAAPKALAQNCFPTVVGWTGSYTLTGNGTGQIGGTTVTVNEQYQGQVQLNTMANGCSPLHYLGSLPTSSGSINDSFVNPCSSGGSATSTWVAPSQPANNTTAILSIDLSNGTYTFGPVAPLTATVIAQTCDGGATTATFPSSLGSPDPVSPWPPSFTLPATPQELKVENFQFNAAGGPTATVVPWTLSFTLDPIYDTDDPCEKNGSSIGCENQSLGEDVPIVGTGFNLHYEGSRAPGAGANSVASTDGFMIGGWTLSVHHAYDQTTNTLFLGDGRQRNGYRLGTPVSFNGNTLLTSEDGDEIYVFDGSTGRHLQTLKPLTGALEYQFGYDAAGNLVTVTDGSGNVTTIQRGASEQPSAIVSPYGQTTPLSLDSNGFLSQITDPLGISVTFTNTSQGLITTLTDANGNVYNFSYDDQGRLAKDADPAAGYTALSRSATATPTVTTTPTPNSTPTSSPTQTPTPTPPPTSTTGPTNGTSGLQWTVTEVTAMGQTSSFQTTVNLPWVQTNTSTLAEQRTVTWPNGLQATSSETQQNGQFSDKFSLPDGTSSSMTTGPDPRWGIQVPIVNSQALTISGLTMNSATTRSAILATPGNPFSLVSQQDSTTVNGQTYMFTYTASTTAPSGTYTIESPAARNFTLQLDANERIASIQVGNLLATNLGYDGHGRLASLTQGTRSETLTYDNNGYLANITDALGQQTTFTYDAAGHRLTTTLADGRTINYTYDANGNLTSVTPPGKTAHNFSFTAVNLTSSYSPPAIEGTGATIYAYDADRRLTMVTRPDNSSVRVVYDCCRPTQMTIAQGSYTYTYDPTAGHLSEITAPDGGMLAYSYNGPLLTSATWTGTITGAVSETYNNDLRLASLGVNGTPINFGYDADGLLTQAGSLTLKNDPQDGNLTGTTLGNESETFTYNDFGELTTSSASDGATVLLAETYGRDQLGRITQKVETSASVTTTFAYTYDPAGRLIQVQQNGATTATYTYDSNGNRITVNGGGGMTTGSYDDQDRLTQYGGTTYSYTANGEVLSQRVNGQTISYIYDELGNLVSVVQPDGTLIEYVIDGQNRRIGKKVAGTLVQGFLYQDQRKIVAELDGESNVVSQFVYASRGNVPDYMVKNGTTYRIITDQLGSPRMVVDVATGAIAQEMVYDEFGQVMQDTNPGFQPFGFAGGLYDRNSQLVRFGARDYDPQTGRWTAKDPVGFANDTNLYTYARNNPVNFVDTNGKKFVGLTPELDAVIGQLMTNPNIGPAVKSFYSREDIEIYIKEESCEKMRGAGGGNTDPQFGPRGGVDTYTVTINQSVADATSRALWGIGTTLEQLVAHELGHVQAYTEVIPPGDVSDVRSLEWENSLRMGGPLRPQHKSIFCPQIPCP